MNMSPKDAKYLAKKFIAGPRGKIWPFVRAQVRSGMIDAAVMDHVRASNAAGNQKPLTPEDLMAFRLAVAIALSDLEWIEFK